jgi:pimeloyl-ACP methyl ester carboxylesterase
MKVAERHLSRHGISFRHVPMNWYAKEPYPELLERMVAIVKEEQTLHGSVTLCGVSAGGSLAVNILSRLHSKNLWVVVLCGPVKVAKLTWWDRRTLESIASRDPKRPSQIFFDSVTYCSAVAIPALTEHDKQHVMTVQQWADTVVPRPTMGIPGVRIFRVPGVGHTLGIGISVLYLPAILQALLQDN